MVFGWGKEKCTGNTNHWEVSKRVGADGFGAKLPNFLQESDERNHVSLEYGWQIKTQTKDKKPYSQDKNCHSAKLSLEFISHMNKSFTSQLWNSSGSLFISTFVFRDVNFSMLFSCLQRCTPAKLPVETNLEEPKHKKEHHLNTKLSLFGEIRLQEISKFKRSSQFQDKCFRKCHWGQTCYLPNLYSGRMLLGNSTCLMRTKKKFEGK